MRQALRVAEENGARYGRCDDPEVLDRRLSEMFDLHEQRWALLIVPAALLAEHGATAAEITLLTGGE